LGVVSVPDIACSRSSSLATELFEPSELIDDMLNGLARKLVARGDIKASSASAGRLGNLLAMSFCIRCSCMHCDKFGAENFDLNDRDGGAASSDGLDGDTNESLRNIDCGGDSLDESLERPRG